MLPEDLFVELNSEPGPRRDSDLTVLKEKLRLDDVFDVISRSSHIGCIDLKIKSRSNACNLTCQPRSPLQAAPAPW